MKKNTTITTVAIVFMLSACQEPIELNTAQVSALADEGLCELSNSRGPIKATTWAAVSSEVNRRKLDCSPAHRKCASFGYRKGTKAYGKCRMEIERMTSSERQTQQRVQSEQKQIDSLMQGLQKMQDDQQMHDSIVRPW